MASVTTEFDLRTSSQSGFGLGTGLGEYTFADAGNLEHCIKYLNQTLVTFGFPASLDLFANDPVRVGGCIAVQMFRLRGRAIVYTRWCNKDREILSSESLRMSSDRDFDDQEAKAAAAFKAQIEKLQQERDEFQRMVIGNQEKLNQVLMEKKKESKSGMEIVNLLQKEGRPRGTWNGKKADSDFYKMIVDAYEVKKQELMAENEQLRALLRSMQMDMRDFLNAPNGLAKQTTAVNERPDADPPQSPLGGKKDVFDLPLHMARDQIEESLRTKMTSIKERMVQLQDAQKEAEVTSEASERELELEAQLVEARSIIQEQASIMSKQLAKSKRPR
ncbi:hypothetical protein GIB67_035735 [Kingdonia uniflora]|uniref:Uncharacterized protein n=1 Tax=Kingdonia uniflora TaxID=39325 RepID=A0A7J7NVW4_9MAGN|nr:hypothetical protein GIB67_035735 [Kingdonia uniflora]